MLFNLDGTVQHIKKNQTQNIQMFFLPANTIILIQSLYQGTIKTKKHYTEMTIIDRIQVTDAGDGNKKWQSQENPRMFPMN